MNFDGISESAEQNKLGVELSISCLEFEKDKHVAGKKALAKTAFYENGLTSISHSGNIAFAVSTPKTHDQLGIGIDYEVFRPLDIRASKMFLTQKERFSLTDQSSENLVRLWTIKEASFKSLPNNDGLFLRNFEVTLDEDQNGELKCIDHPSYLIRFETTKYPQGYLTIALCTKN